MRMKSLCFVDGAKNAANLRICEALPVDLQTKREYPLLLHPPLTTYETCHLSEEGLAKARRLSEILYHIAL